ncbi:unnamed protein product [Gongylonema pulchrum]|uniref:Uncharacterized protein n=1 Tax=Gongylonema pulchrum TaxID=637853 RepID=A0A183DLV7_9BILA|nr:unnamed protein product [Gongylonema pulchrum]
MVPSLHGSNLSLATGKQEQQPIKYVLTNCNDGAGTSSNAMDNNMQMQRVCINTSNATIQGLFHLNR